jgi:hypothetical protein
VRFWRHVVEHPKEKHASVDAKLLRPSVDTALIEKMSIAGRMLETRAAALSHCAIALIPIMYGNAIKGCPRATHARGLVETDSQQKAKHFGTIGGGGWTSSSRKRA